MTILTIIRTLGFIGHSLRFMKSELTGFYCTWRRKLLMNPPTYLTPFIATCKANHHFKIGQTLTNIIFRKNNILLE